MSRRENMAIRRTLMRFAEGDISAIDRKELSTADIRILEGVREQLEAKDVESRRIRMKSAMDAAGVAHDIKTPLSVIMGAAECLSDGMDDKDYLAIIKEKGEYMNSVIDNLTGAARELAGTGEPIKETVDVRGFFEEEFRKQRLFFESTGIEMKIRRAPKNAKVIIDRKKMSRVIQNIITNAVKYTPYGGKIRIGFHTYGSKIVIAVRDNGQGISEESLPFVFDKFFMEDKARREVKGGSSSGLGLFVVKEIVEEHGGEVKVKSKKGKGSTFYIILPLKPDSDKNRTNRFDALPLAAKLTIVTIFGVFVNVPYRIGKFVQSHDIRSIFGAVLSIGLMPFMWIFDILSVIFYGKITFLAD